MQLVANNSDFRHVDEGPRVTSTWQVSCRDCLSLPQIEKLPKWERAIWSLCSVLLEGSDDGSQRLAEFRAWLQREVQQQSRSAMRKIKRANRRYNPYTVIFYLMIYGNFEEAANVASLCGDTRLARMIVSPLNFTERQKEIVRLKRLEGQESNYFKEKGSWYRESIWRILYGQLSEVTLFAWAMQCKFSWLEILCTTIFFGSMSDTKDPLCELLNIYKRLSSLLSNPCDCRDMEPSRHFLDWWFRQQEGCERKGNGNQKIDISMWPSSLAWLYSMQHPELFDEQERVRATEEWCENLKDSQLMEQAIFSALLTNW